MDYGKMLYFYNRVPGKNSQGKNSAYNPAKSNNFKLYLEPRQIKEWCEKGNKFSKTQVHKPIHKYT